LQLEIHAKIESSTTDFNKLFLQCSKILAMNGASNKSRTHDLMITKQLSMPDYILVN
jgi:hypothetical protein